uniref:Tr-type G domain-containing protein n=1 Tax=Panagrellus redivivus TaxID=6233 RepID=A0A7E4UZ74_PANRE
MTTDRRLAALSAAFAAGDDEDEDFTICTPTKSCDFLVKNDEESIKHYIENIKDQLAAGEGETFIEIGSCYDGSIITGLSKEDLDIAVAKNAEILEKINCKGYPLTVATKSKNKFSQVVFIRKNIDEKDFIEVRVAVVGNVDAGKSTMLGVLTHNTLDDGRGKARQCLFRHKHEFETGRTSSVGNDILGFGMDGKPVNNPDPHSGQLDWPTVCCDAAKVITFIDLAGHEKYLKTTIFGMTGHMPDYAMLMVGSNAGIVGTTREHFSIALNLNIPVFVVVTKIDMCPENVLQQTMKMVDRLAKSGGSNKFPVVIKNMEDVVHVARNFSSGTLCPIIQVSNVTGFNLDLLRSFMNLLPLHRGNHSDAPAEFQIDETFSVEGVGTVVSGTCTAGSITVGDTLLIGPDALGQFVPVPIKSIHRKRVPVNSIKAGQTGSFAVKKFGRRDVRKGMVLIDPSLKPIACTKFEADVFILHHPTTIMSNYQAMIHAGPVRQTATLVSMDKEVLRTGDRARVMLSFIRHPEYIKEGTRIIFREGRTKAVGIVRKIIPVERNNPVGSKTAKKGAKHVTTFFPVKNNKMNKQKGLHHAKH